MRPVYPGTSRQPYSDIYADDRNRWHQREGNAMVAMNSAVARAYSEAKPPTIPPNLFAMESDEFAAVHGARMATLTQRPRPAKPANSGSRFGWPVLVTGSVIAIVLVLLLAAGSGDSSDPRGATYCDENPYARNCPQEDESQRDFEDAARKAVDDYGK